MEIRIISIQTDEGFYENPYVGITHLRWINERNDNTGTVSRVALYNWIKENNGVAYIKDNDGNKINLLAELSPTGNKYLRTATDDLTFDNLLNLVECEE